ncbi:hypothetical protein GA0115250_136445, partial [Streptomyces sp. BvitLS-983]
AQHVGGGGHVERVGGGRRGAGLQGGGQLGLVLPQPLADALAEERLVLQGGGQRVPGELDAAAGG